MTLHRFRHFLWAALLTPVLLMACGEKGKSKNLPLFDKESAQSFADRFASEGTLGSAVLAEGETVQMRSDRTLIYRNNLNAQCLITAYGRISSLVVDRKPKDARENNNFVITYSYQNVTSTVGESTCADSDSACHQKTADCAKVLQIIRDNLNIGATAIIPTNMNDKKVLLTLSPIGTR